MAGSKAENGCDVLTQAETYSASPEFYQLDHGKEIGRLKNHKRPFDEISDNYVSSAQLFPLLRTMIQHRAAENVNETAFKLDTATQTSTSQFALARTYSQVDRVFQIGVERALPNLLGSQFQTFLHFQRIVHQRLGLTEFSSNTGCPLRDGVPISQAELKKVLEESIHMDPDRPFGPLFLHVLDRIDRLIDQYNCPPQWREAVSDCRQQLDQVGQRKRPRLQDDETEGADDQDTAAKSSRDVIFAFMDEIERVAKEEGHIDNESNPLLDHLTPAKLFAELEGPNFSENVLKIGEMLGFQIDDPLKRDRIAKGFHCGVLWHTIEKQTPSGKKRAVKAYLLLTRVLACCHEALLDDARDITPHAFWKQLTADNEKGLTNLIANFGKIREAFNHRNYSQRDFFYALWGTLEKNGGIEIADRMRKAYDQIAVGAAPDAT